MYSKLFTIAQPVNHYMGVPQEHTITKYHTFPSHINSEFQWNLELSVIIMYLLKYLQRWRDLVKYLFVSKLFSATALPCGQVFVFLFEELPAQ